MIYLLLITIVLVELDLVAISIENGLDIDYGV